jgi:arylformamidase
MTLYDATLPLVPEMATWPGEPGPDRTLIKSIAGGDPANVSRLCMGMHTGTHVDAPVHFIPGAPAIESVPLDALIGPGLIIDMGDVPAITADLLRGLNLPAGLKRVLFKSRNSGFIEDRQFHKDFTYIAHDAAPLLVEHGLRLVGVDYLSVEGFDQAEPLTHRTLLGAGVAIVEGANLGAVPAGAYMIMALPIKLVGSDAGSTRLVLQD